MADPTRPQPTIKTNISIRQYTRKEAKQAYGRTPSRVPSSPAGGAVRITLEGAFSIT